jgi:acyl-coenzyme A synthetase/AMP-(fatty) acid ligase
MNHAVTPEYFNFSTDVFDHWAALRPQGVALWCVDAVSGQERRLTFRELSCLSVKAAQVFRSQGLRPGDRVLLMLPRIWEWWAAMLGLIRLGAVPIPATHQLMPRDLAYRLETALVSAVLTSPEGTSKFPEFDGIRLTTGPAPEGWLDFNAALECVPANLTVARTRSSDPGIIYFTSATTGDPKMVLHTQASYGLAHRVTGQLWLDCQPADVHWNLSDPGWAKAAWSSFFGPWHMGACVFAVDTHGKFDPAQVLDILAHFPITTWCAPPTALRLSVRQNLSKWRFSTLRHCVTAGEPLNPEVSRLWRAATGLELYEAYGQTETCALIGNFRPHNVAVRPGSMGKVTPGFNVALVDDDLNVVAAGCEGEIAVRTSPVRPLGLFKEYWMNPKETARRFRGGWYLTGDRAVRDVDGYFWFVGRSDDVIKSSGYRIGPFEVESVLLEHPAVLEAAVVGEPDAVRGQIVKAFVVLRPGSRGSDELKRELQQHFKQTAAPYKYPRAIEFVAALPKTASGKTRHRSLREVSAGPASLSAATNVAG